MHLNMSTCVTHHSDIAYDQSLTLLGIHPVHRHRKVLKQGGREVAVINYKLLAVNNYQTLFAGHAAKANVILK